MKENEKSFNQTIETSAPQMNVDFNSESFHFWIILRPSVESLAAQTSPGIAEPVKTLKNK